MKLWRVWGCKKGRCFVAVTRDFQPKHPPRLIRSIIRNLPKSIIRKIINICIYETQIKQVTKLEMNFFCISCFEQTFFMFENKILFKPFWKIWGKFIYNLQIHYFYNNRQDVFKAQCCVLYQVQIFLFRSFIRLWSVVVGLYYVFYT